MLADTVQQTFDGFQLKEPLPKFPTTRFQGSKRKILEEISNLVDTINCKTVLDLYSGSGIVSLLFRHLGKQVTSNDFLLYNTNTAKVFLNCRFAEIDLNRARKELRYLLEEAPLKTPTLVSENYSGIYFIDSENMQIDRFCQNISEHSEFIELYTYAVGQALIKKRPYNLFHRANLGMRTKDVERSFGNAKTWETPILEHAIKCIAELQKFPTNCFDDSLTHNTTNFNTNDLSNFSRTYDLVYLDPPYINGSGVAVDYSDFYNFLEGLLDYQLFSAGDTSYPHRPINKKHSAWLEKTAASNELAKICNYWKDSVIVMSYRSDGIPKPSEIVEIMSCEGRVVEIHSAGEYQYALSKNKSNEEIFVVSKPSNT